MEVLHQRCAGMDISKRDAKVCVRTPGARHNTFVKVVTVSGAMTNDIIALRDYLLTEQVTLVVMEATGDYWRPFYYLLDPALNVMLVNARHAKNMPGRKTDASDAQWGWSNSAPTDLFAPPLCRPKTSDSYGISPGHERSSWPRRAARFNVSRNCLRTPTSNYRR